MTKEFKEELKNYFENKEMVDRLAKARNSEDGSYLLITQEGDEEMYISGKGDGNKILLGIGHFLKRKIFSDVSNDEARIIRDALKKVIADDEERRFQEAGE